MLTLTRMICIVYTVQGMVYNIFNGHVLYVSTIPSTLYNIIFYFLFFFRLAFIQWHGSEKIYLSHFVPSFFYIFSVFRFFDEIKQKTGDVKMCLYLAFYICIIHIWMLLTYYIIHWTFLHWGMSVLHVCVCICMCVYVCVCKWKYELNITFIKEIGTHECIYSYIK